MNLEFAYPEGIIGVGSDIAWCGRWHGGKFCQFCRHYADFNNWTKDWHWYYLLKWYDMKSYPVKIYWNLSQSHYKFRGKHWNGVIKGTFKSIEKYNTKGLNEKELNSLLKKGCKKDKKCRCVKVAQRGHWYCPECFVVLNSMAKHNGLNLHDLMVLDRDELKQEFLINRLSGIY